jgi:hypothetical protein
MKVAGIILTVLGIIGVIVFGIQAASDSESLSVLGMDIAVSTANWTPLIISAVVLIVGIIFTSSKSKSNA